MLGRMKVRGLLGALRRLSDSVGDSVSKDEQTDDLQGFPRTLGEHAAVNGLNEAIVFERRVPPCTGYERDYEDVERVYSDKPGY